MNLTSAKDNIVQFTHSVSGSIFKKFELRNIIGLNLSKRFNLYLSHSAGILHKKFKSNIFFTWNKMIEMSNFLELIHLSQNKFSLNGRFLPGKLVRQYKVNIECDGESFINLDGNVLEKKGSNHTFKIALNPRKAVNMKFYFDIDIKKCSKIVFNAQSRIFSFHVKEACRSLSIDSMKFEVKGLGKGPIGDTASIYITSDIKPYFGMSGKLTIGFAESVSKPFSIPDISERAVFYINLQLKSIFNSLKNFQTSLSLNQLKELSTN